MNALLAGHIPVSTPTTKRAQVLTPGAQGTAEIFRNAEAGGAALDLLFPVKGTHLAAMEFIARTPDPWIQAEREMWLGGKQVWVPSMFAKSGLVETMFRTAPPDPDHWPPSTAVTAGVLPQNTVATGSVRTAFEMSKTMEYVEFGFSLATLPIQLWLGGKFYDSVVPALQAAQARLQTRNSQAYIDSEASANYEEFDSYARRQAESDSESAEEELLDIGAGQAVTVQWGTVVGTFVVMAALAAVPIVLALIEKAMYAQLMILNLTEEEVKSELGAIPHGAVVAQPSAPGIPAMSVTKDGGSQGREPIAYQADYGFHNSTGITSIAYIVGIGLPDGTQAAVAMTVPYSNSNTLWVGSTSKKCTSTSDWEAEFGSLVSEGKLVAALSQKAQVGAYTLALSTTQLEGRTVYDDSYTYPVYLTVRKT